MSNFKFGGGKGAVDKKFVGEGLDEDVFKFNKFEGGKGKGRSLRQGLSADGHLQERNLPQQDYQEDYHQWI